MTGRIDTERILDAFLAPEADQLPDRVVDAALDEIARTPQRRARRVPWRFPTMIAVNRAAVVASAIVAVVAFGGLLYLLQPGGGFGGRATPSPFPTATASPVPTAAAPVTPTANPMPVSFTSPLYGCTVTVPAGWAVTPATIPWPEGADPKPDVFASPVTLRPNFDNVYVAAQPVPEGMTSAAWLLGYANRVAASGRDCKGPVGAWTDAVVGSLPIRRMDLECLGLRFTDVAFVVDGAGWVMSGNREVIAQFLDAFEQGT